MGTQSGFNIKRHISTLNSHESLGNNPVVCKKDIKYIDQNKSGTIIYHLSDHDLYKQMDTYLVRFAKASGIEGFFNNAFGQIFCHILSGEIRFDLEGKSYLLKQGDNIYFNAKVRHDAINNYEGVSELLWVQSPPNF